MLGEGLGIDFHNPSVRVNAAILRLFARQIRPGSAACTYADLGTLYGAAFSNEDPNINRFPFPTQPSSDSSNELLLSSSLQSS